MDAPPSPYIESPVVVMPAHALHRINECPVCGYTWRPGSEAECRDLGSQDSMSSDDREFSDPGSSSHEDDEESGDNVYVTGDGFVVSDNE